VRPFYEVLAYSTPRIDTSLHAEYDCGEQTSSKENHPVSLRFKKGHFTLITKQSLIADFSALGMQPGDTIFVHSAYSTLGRAPGGVEGGPQTVIDAILEVIGPAGTLIVPNFNYGFLRGSPWDIRTTPSQMGVLTELVRTDPRARRMFHAVYSMAAIGPHAEELAAHRSSDCFGETTAFAKLVEWDAKILILGLPYSKSITFLHYCEQVAEVNYRFLKEFSGVAIDAQGKPHQETYTMFVRDVDRGVVLDFEPIGALLDAQVVHKTIIGTGEVRLMSCREVCRIAVQAMRDHPGPGLTYVLESPERARDWIPPMKPISSLKDVLGEILPLHRTLASDGMDQALEIIGSYLPETAHYNIETYTPLTPVWTWYVPERYVVHAAYLETEDGHRVLDFQDNPLHLVSYSLPIDAHLSWNELAPHLYYNEQRPQAIPWKFKYYDRNWGFCLSKDLFDRLPRDQKYHVVIRSEFATDPAQGGFKVADAVLHPQGGANPAAGEMFIMAHVCHPNQANDDAAGVVTAIEVARRLAARPLPAGSMSVRFWFGPETIGTIAYLAHHEERISALRGGIFIEMTGNDNTIALQHTRQHDVTLDQVGQAVLKKRGAEFREGTFADIIANDERILNGPGINVPCLSISRYPYPEYHTTDDNLEIMREEKLQEAADVIEEIIRVYASDYRPLRKFRGPVFLSGHGLFVDWQVNWKLNRSIEKMMMRFEGRQSVFEIAAELDLDYWETREYIEKFRVRGLIEALPLPEAAERA
jgi:aminopeptidase-like protein/aminoglycoside N3'-acetyltransferase